MTDDLPTASELFQAYYDCRRTKRNTWNALEFEERLERNLMDLLHELRSGEYRPGRSICFVVEHPKVREVWAANFRDRVVHHLLYNRVSKRFHRAFIHDSYACIPGKGTHRAVDRAEHFARSLTENYRKPGCVLKMDVANFFVSIKKDILDAQLAKRIHEPWWLALARQILHHDPTQDPHVKSHPALLRKVPKHKSLFHAGGNGLPIGNLTSQFFANVYLDVLDQYAKRELGCKRWIRYVDDILVMGSSGPDLHDISLSVDKFLRDRLGVALHPNKTSINQIDKGFDFLGFVCRPHARYVRRFTVRSAMNKLRGLCRAKTDPYKIQATANSYFGIFSQANAYRQRAAMAEVLRNAGHLVSPLNNRMFCGDPL